MLYLIQKTEPVNQEKFFLLSYQNDVTYLFAAYEDWEEFMILFPTEIAHSIKLDKKVEIPAHVESRINFCKELHNDEIYYDTVLQNKILEILQENSFPDDVLEALPDYITYAQFTSKSFFYRYTRSKDRKEIKDPIMQWYREEDEGTLTCKRDNFGVWSKKEQFE